MLNRKCQKILKKEEKLSRRVEQWTSKLRKQNDSDIEKQIEYLTECQSRDVFKSGLISKVCYHINDQVEYAIKDNKRLQKFEDKMNNTSKSIIEEAKQYLDEITKNKSKNNSAIDKITNAYGSRSKMYE